MYAHGKSSDHISYRHVINVRRFYFWINCSG